MTAEIQDLIAEHANRHGLITAALLTALIQVESGGNPYAWRPEPGYRWLWDVKLWAPLTGSPKDVSPPTRFASLAGSVEQEWWGQRCSWGLMQVMGALARELGCREPYLTCLVDPAVNLHYGCLHLANLLKWAKGDTEQALAAYNGGKAGNKTRPFRNASYAAKVLAHMEAPV